MHCVYVYRHARAGSSIAEAKQTAILFLTDMEVGVDCRWIQFSRQRARAKNDKERERESKTTESEASKRRTCARRKFPENWKIINWQTTLKKLARSARMLPDEIFCLFPFFFSFLFFSSRRKLPSSLILINLLKKFPGSAAAASVFLLLLFLFRVYVHRLPEMGRGR